MARDDERRAAAEVTARLRSRGVLVAGTDRPEDLADLLSAVERFEAAVEAHGGDLMVDDLQSAAPDDPHFVLPRRQAGGAIKRYIAEIDAATARLRRHPPHTD